MALFYIHGRTLIRSAVFKGFNCGVFVCFCYSVFIPPSSTGLPLLFITHLHDTIMHIDVITSYCASSSVSILFLIISLFCFISSANKFATWLQNLIQNQKPQLSLLWRFYKQDKILKLARKKQIIFIILLWLKFVIFYYHLHYMNNTSNVNFYNLHYSLLNWIFGPCRLSRSMCKSSISK